MEVTTRGPIAVRQRHLSPRGHLTEAGPLGPHHAGQLRRLLIRACQEERVPAHQVVRQVQGHRVPLGRGLVATADPAARVVGPERGPRALPELERGQRLPLRVKAVHLGQLHGPRSRQNVGRYGTPVAPPEEGLPSKIITMTVSSVPAAPISFCRTAATKATTAMISEQMGHTIQNLLQGNPCSQ